MNEQNPYKFIPSSAKSTRQVLSEVSSTNPITKDKTITSNDPNSQDFRPQVFRRRSTNYADADAAARAAYAAATQSSLAQQESPEDGRRVSEDKNATGTGGGSVAWKPEMGRKQSWSQEDQKRNLHMSLVNESEALPGFTEGKPS